MVDYNKEGHDSEVQNAGQNTDLHSPASQNEDEIRDTMFWTYLRYKEKEKLERLYIITLVMLVLAPIFLVMGLFVQQNQAPKGLFRGIALTRHPKNEPIVIRQPARINSLKPRCRRSKISFEEGEPELKRISNPSFIWDDGLQDFHIPEEQIRNDEQLARELQALNDDVPLIL